MDQFRAISVVELQLLLFIEKYNFVTIRHFCLSHVSLVKVVHSLTYRE